MNLYEVIFCDAQDRTDDADTIYLVRAPDFHAAMELVAASASPQAHSGVSRPLAQIVREIGNDLSRQVAPQPCILRGPYVQCAYNYGWRTWNRKVVDGEFTGDWEEEIPLVKR